MCVPDPVILSNIDAVMKDLTKFKVCVMQPFPCTPLMHFTVISYSFYLFFLFIQYVINYDDIFILKAFGLLKDTDADWWRKFRLTCEKTVNAKTESKPPLWTTLGPYLTGESVSSIDPDVLDCIAKGELKEKKDLLVSTLLI